MENNHRPLGTTSDGCRRIDIHQMLWNFVRESMPSSNRTANMTCRIEFLILAQNKYTNEKTEGERKDRVNHIELNSIIMIPPTCFLRIIRGRTNIPIIIRWTALDDKFIRWIDPYGAHRDPSCTLSLQLESMERILRQTALILKAGDQSSVKMDKQMCPLE